MTVMGVPIFVARALARLGRRWVRCRDDMRGVAAVEFGLLALPFIALIFAILETALLYFASQTLETAVYNSARLIRTGQAQQQGMSSATFKQTICDQVGVMFDCANGLWLDVETYPDFASISLTPPLDQTGNLNTANFKFNMGSGSNIVVVHAYYEWPTFSKLLGLNYSNLADGNHLLAATAAFKNEPFPW
jgi:Flp pilus assembly protein TadG